VGCSWLFTSKTPCHYKEFDSRLAAKADGAIEAANIQSFIQIHLLISLSTEKDGSPGENAQQAQESQNRVADRSKDHEAKGLRSVTGRPPLKSTACPPPDPCRGSPYHRNFLCHSVTSN
jgi:hypothetical protein